MHVTSDTTDASLITLCVALLGMRGGFAIHSSGPFLGICLANA